MQARRFPTRGAPLEPDLQRSGYVSWRCGCAHRLGDSSAQLGGAGVVVRSCAGRDNMSKSQIHHQGSVPQYFAVAVGSRMGAVCLGHWRLKAAAEDSCPSEVLQTSWGKLIVCLLVSRMRPPKFATMNGSSK